MYCRNCGKEVDEKADVCLSCGTFTVEVKKLPQFYKAGFVLGILSLCIPLHGLILGVIGLPLACISKRRSSIIMNIIGIVVWVVFYIMLLTNVFNPYHYY